MSSLSCCWVRPKLCVLLVAVALLCTSSLSLLSFVSGNSSGLGIPCDVDQRLLGNTPRLMTVELQKGSGRNMTWSLRPVFAGNRYTVRSGDGAAGSDATSYVPDQYTTIFVRTNVQDQQFNGLLMYAVNSGGVRVGEWLLPPRQFFQIDPVTGCVTHSNADPKSYKSAFRVKFPRGTGTVTIKALIKYGLPFPEAQGAFYWPNDRHLELSEGQPEQQVWFEGEVGQSCNFVCAKKNMGCDLDGMQRDGVSAALLSTVSKTTACFGPMMKGCGSQSPTWGTEGCFYQDPSCTREPGYPTMGPVRPLATIDCNSVKTSQDDGHRLCVCKGGMPTSTATDPPLPPTILPTAPPTVRVCTTRAPTSAPTTAAPTAAPTPAVATSDSIMLVNGPAVIPPSGTFQIQMQYSALGARTLAADVLQPSTGYRYYGGGFTTVAAGTTGFATITITMQDNPASGTEYVINYFIVDSAVHQNGNNPQSYTQALPNGQTSVMSAPVTITAGAPAPTVTVTQQPPQVVPVVPAAAGDDPDCTDDATGTGTGNGNTDPTLPPVIEDPTPTPTKPNGGKPLNNRNSGSQSATSSHLLISLLLSVSMTGVTSRSGSVMMLFTLSCLLLLCGVPGISAHNWLSSPARANDGGLGQFNGNTAPPCPPKTGRIHAQVAAGQAFPVEWATGHGFGSFTYLAVIKATDEQFLRQLDEKTMDLYLQQAPSTNYLSDPKYKLYHVTNNGVSRDPSLGADVTTTLLPQRPSIFRREPNPRFYEKQFAAVKDNKRAQYFNPRFPYLVSVHKFALNEDRPDEMDYVLMEIPRGSTPGQYVIQYQWRGFNDCMDVNVLSVESTDIWGSRGPAGDVYDKYHHTIYNPQLTGFSAQPNQGQGCMVIPEGQTVQACQNLCNNGNTRFRVNNQDTNCDAVTVAPAQLNAIVKFPGLHKGLTSHLPASCDTVVTGIAAANRATAQVCFIQKSGVPPSVGPATKTVSDPEDSVFYMTTYARKGNWVFAQKCDTCTPPNPPTDFRFADRCISCADMQRNFLSNLPPRWTIQNTCQHCDNRLG